MCLFTKNQANAFNKVQQKRNEISIATAGISFGGDQGPKGDGPIRGYPYVVLASKAGENFTKSKGKSTICKLVFCFSFQILTIILQLFRFFQRKFGKKFSKVERWAFMEGSRGGAPQKVREFFQSEIDNSLKTSLAKLSLITRFFHVISQFK